MVTQVDIEQGLASLGLSGADVVVHASLRSFGSVDGGAATVVDAVRRVARTVLMPAFCFESNVPPPAGDRPARNGCDYRHYDHWDKPLVPFRVETAAVDARMGAIAREFASAADAVRSDHPWHSWAGSGARAERLLRPHPWSCTNLPLDRLAERDGSVVLLGVGLTACTAIHVSEERAGRRPFIRWAADRDGVVRRMRVAGCSKGFGALEPLCDDLFRETVIGTSRVRVAPLRALIDRCADVMRREPRLTICSESCLRCLDAAEGGPLDREWA